MYSRHIPFICVATVFLYIVPLALNVKVKLINISSNISFLQMLSYRHEIRWKFAPESTFVRIFGWPWPFMVTAMLNREKRKQQISCFIIKLGSPSWGQKKGNSVIYWLLMSDLTFTQGHGKIMSEKRKVLIFCFIFKLESWSWCQIRGNTFTHWLLMSDLTFTYGHGKIMSEQRKMLISCFIFNLESQN